MKNSSFFEKLIFFILFLFLIGELIWLGYTYIQDEKKTFNQEEKKTINSTNSQEININDLISKNNDKYNLEKAPEFNQVVLNYLDGTRKLNYINFIDSSYITNIYQGRVIEVRKDDQVKIKNPIDGYQPIFQIVFAPIKEEIKDLTLNIYMNQDEYRLSTVELIKPGGIVENKTLEDLQPKQLIKVVEKFDLKDNNRLTIYQISINEE